jgi:glutamate dehydrogenase (NAD(P)+)
VFTDPLELVDQWGPEKLVLDPAAREDAIDTMIAGTTTARLVVEGANLPTTPAAKEILDERGVVVVPDFVANAGGIVAAAHSTEARYSPFAVDPASVFAMISEKLRGNTQRILNDSRRDPSTPRQAAIDLAQARVLAAMTARGFRPSERTTTHPAQHAA